VPSFAVNSAVENYLDVYMKLDSCMMMVVLKLAEWKCYDIRERRVVAMLLLAENIK
jgi:hypothetical protein